VRFIIEIKQESKMSEETKLKKKEDKKVNRYLKSIVKLGKKYGFVLSHEDCQGGFEVIKRENTAKYIVDFDEWLMNACYENGEIGDE
jgi:hypothetical protein